jgi:hypothetical protein
MSSTTKLISLFSTQSESERIAWIHNNFGRDSNKQYTDLHGNHVIIRGGAELYPTLTAHLDTVHDSDFDDKKIVCYDRQQGLLMSPQGIGGDDLCGIWIAYQVYCQTTCPLQIIFCHGEEGPRPGSNEFKFTHKPSFIVGIDRRGDSDLVTSIMGQSIAGRKLKQIILPIAKQHNYNQVSGMFTDVYSFALKGFAGVNVSAGYYSPHTLHEYVVISAMDKAIGFILALLQAVPVKAYRVAVDHYVRSYPTLFSVPKIEKRIETECTGMCVFCGSSYATWDEVSECYLCYSCSNTYKR